MSEAEHLRDEVVRSLSDEVLHLILLPTEKCNFRCTYCYEDFSVGRMPSDVVSGIERMIERRAPGLRLLGIDWFGGEPLLARDIVEQVSARVSDVARANPRMRYS